MSGNAVQSYTIRTAPNTIKMDFNSRLPLNTQPMYSPNYFARPAAVAGIAVSNVPFLMTPEEGNK